MSKALSEQSTLYLDGRRVGVRFIRNHMARRIILRLDQSTESTEDGVVVTLPTRTSVQQGLDLVHDKSDWVLKRIDSLAPRVTLSNGAVVPLGGVSHVIRHAAAMRGLVQINEQQIYVPGGIEHLERRVKDWFKGEAKDRIQLKVRDKVSFLGCKPGRITIRDTKSRWGSCSHNGNLSFSWRLVMAPENILDYVVAHEVSHLVEHNHGAKFWHLVSCLTENLADSREWLKCHGEGLHRIG